MQAVAEKRNPVSWLGWGVLALAVAVVIAFLAGAARETIDLGPPAGEVRALTFQTVTPEDGPVPGMPRDTFESVTGVTFLIPTLDQGPVPGIPRGTFETVAGDSRGAQPVGMPNYVWEEING